MPSLRLPDNRFCRLTNNSEYLYLSEFTSIHRDKNILKLVDINVLFYIYTLSVEDIFDDLN